MVPRLLSSQFGLLDDGMTVSVARQIGDEWTTAFRVTKDTGRYFPVYWLFHSLVYLVAGARAFWFFAANTLVFTAITLGLMWLVVLLGGSRIQAGAAGFVFALSGVAIGTAYTLSKAEPVQLLWIVASLLLICRSATARRLWSRAAWVVAASGALLLAYSTKETALVMVPISLGWAIAGRRLPRSAGAALWPRAAYFAGSVAATVAFVSLRYAFGPAAISQGTYTKSYQLQWSIIGPSVVEWGAWLARDFVYIAPLLALLIVVGPSSVSPGQRRLMVDAVIWMIGWVAVFLPWSSVVEYYLLPFALGAAILGGVLGGHLLAALKTSTTRGGRWGIAAGLGLAGALWLLTMINGLTAARVQLAVDAANADLLDMLAGIPPNSTVLVGLPAPNEYAFEIWLHLTEFKGRPDIRVLYAEEPLAIAPEPIAPLYFLVPWMRNLPLPAPRVAVSATEAAVMNAVVGNWTGRNLDRVFQAGRRVRVVDIGLQQLVCGVAGGRPGSSICGGGRPLVYRQTFSYGWSAYRLGDRPVVVNARSPNGIERRQDGRVWLWLGGGVSRVWLFSPHDGRAVLRGSFMMPGLPERASRRLAVSTGWSAEESHLVIGESTREIEVPVRRGINGIAMRVVAGPTAAVLPNGDHRQPLLGIAPLDIVIEPGGERGREARSGGER